MHTSTPLVATAAGLLLASVASAQYSSDFEAFTASPGGDVATGQDGYYIPAGTTSVDFLAYTYAGNALGVIANPNGGNNFIAGNGPAGGAFARAQRDVTFGAGVMTLGYDINVTFQGVAPTAQNAGSVSLQPSAGAQYFIALARWVDVNAPTNWNADYVWFDAAGAQLTESVANPAFQNLSVNTWYRWETDFDLATNSIVEVRLTDIVAGTTATHHPADRYLFAGLAPGAAPTAFRFFGGGGIAGNTLAFDNPVLGPKYGPPDIICYSFDNGDAANTATGGLPDGVVGAGVAFEPNGGICLGSGSPAAGVATVGATCQIDTGWTTDLGMSDWTVGMFLDRTNATAALTALQYPFGNSSAASFRCFVGGVAGTTGILLRGGGLPDTSIPGGGALKKVHVAWCYDSTAMEVRGYLNGVLAVTTVPTAPLNINGTTNMTVMRYNGSSSSLSPGYLLDDFRFYRRCLAVGEITHWAGCADLPIGTPYCDPAVANSTGVPGVLGASGSTIVANNTLHLTASSLPLNSFGFFLASQTTDNVPLAGGGAGTLCLGGDVGRGVGGVIVNSGATGTATVDGDLTQQPKSLGPVAVTPGETWYYQYWYRDVANPTTSNLTNAVCVTYQ